MFFSTKFFFPRVPPLDFFQNFPKFSKIFKSYGNCLILGFSRFFKLFLVFFLKIFHNFGHREGGGVRPNVEFSTFFFFDGFPKSLQIVFFDSVNSVCSLVPNNEDNIRPPRLAVLHEDGRCQHQHNNSSSPTLVHGVLRLRSPGRQRHMWGLCRGEQADVPEKRLLRHHYQGP